MMNNEELDDVEFYEEDEDGGYWTKDGWYIHPDDDVYESLVPESDEDPLTAFNEALDSEASFAPFKLIIAKVPFQEIKNMSKRRPLMLVFDYGDYYRGFQFTSRPPHATKKNGKTKGYWSQFRLHIGTLGKTFKKDSWLDYSHLATIYSLFGTEDLQRNLPYSIAKKLYDEITTHRSELANLKGYNADEYNVFLFMLRNYLRSNQTADTSTNEKQ